MATHEQQMEWLQRIRDESPEQISLGPGKTIELRPAEKIRYEEHDRFAEAIHKELIWLIEQDFDVSKEAIIDQVVKINPKLSKEQWERLKAMVRRVLYWHDKVHQENYKERIVAQVREAIRYMTKETITEEEATFTLSAWGAVIITFHDRKRFKTFFPHGQVDGIKLVVPRNLPGVPVSVTRVLSDVICINGSHPRAALVLKHELFHDVYHMCSGALDTAYRDPDSRGKTFFDLKNEIIAYTFTDTDSPRYMLRHLLNLKGGKTEDEGTEQLKNTLIRELTLDHVGELAPQDLLKKVKAKKVAEAFCRGINSVQGELFRLSMPPRQDHSEEVLKAAIGSTELKELFYKLARIAPAPINIAEIVSTDPSAPIFPTEFIDRVVGCLDYHQPIIRFDDMIERLQSRMQFLSQKEEKTTREAEELRLLAEWPSVCRKGRKNFIHVD